MRYALGIALLLALACSGGETATESVQANETAAAPAAAPLPSADAAKALIAESPEFGDYEFSTGSSFSLPLDTSKFNEPARAGAANLEKGGWIRIAGGRVVLAKGEGDKRFLVRPNGYLDIVPLAKKELLEVSGVRKTTEGAEADIAWKWIPNEVGAAFTSGPVKERFDATHHAIVKMRDFGSGWVVMLIEPASGG
ncbi:MAG TPA: hypothetical protein VFV54_10925 [Thermoanaerobaculia bacterium]|nr:hypothetical protein [Thermoanaerobaculia bacterium]